MAVGEGGSGSTCAQHREGGQYESSRGGSVQRRMREELSPVMLMQVLASTKQCSLAMEGAWAQEYGCASVSVRVSGSERARPRSLARAVTCARGRLRARSLARAVACARGRLRARPLARAFACGRTRLRAV